MKHLIPTLLAFALGNSLSAQHLLPEWRFAAGNTGQDEIFAITTDNSGSVISGGQFYWFVDMDPSANVQNITMNQFHLEPDAFVQKLDANGNLAWVKSFGGSQDSREYVRRLETDDSNNVYVVGYFSKDVFVDSANYVFTNPHINTYGYFLAKLDSNGNVLWAKNWVNYQSGPIAFMNFDTPVISHDGDIYLAMTFNGKIDANPSSLDSVIYSPISISTAYIKLNSSGDYVSSHLLESNTSSVWHGAIRLKNENLYVYGSFRGLVDFDFGPGVSTKNTSGSNDADAYILCMDTAFQFKWVKTHNTTETDLYSTSMNIGHSGHIYTVFFSRRTQFVNISPDPTNPFYLTSSLTSHPWNIVISKMDTLGNLKWMKAMPYTQLQSVYLYELELSDNEKIAINGRIDSDSLDCDPAVNGEYWLNSSGQIDGFAIELDSSGSLIGAAMYGSSVGDDRAWDIDYSVNNELYVGGSFSGTTDFDPTINQDLETSFGDLDMFVMRVSSCPRQADTLTVLSCTDYTMPNGVDIYSSSGLYLDGVFSSQKGCDSSIYVDLTIDPNYLTTFIMQTSAGLVTGKAGNNVQHQWFDCDNNQVIPGAVNDTFMPATNGNYAAILSYSACTDTTTCFAVNNVSIAENTLPEVILYPNPTSGLLHIDSDQAIEKIEVYDLLGREVIASGSETQVDLSTLSSGVYLVKVHLENEVHVRKVLKE
jgi:hypothetical protein